MGWGSPWFLLDQVAVLEQITDQGIDLLQAQGSRGTVLEVMLDEAALVYPHLESQSTGFVHRCGAEFFRPCEHALDAANRDRTLALMKGTTEGANVRAGLLASPQQLMHVEGSAWRAIPLIEAMLAALLTEMLTHELSGVGIEDTNEYAIPLHFHGAPDPTGGCAVVGGIDFHAAVQV